MSYTANPERYQRMIYRKAGDSGLKLPLISLGFWHNFGEKDSRNQMKEMCFTAFDQGITYFDLANNYGPPAGTAEEHFGAILQKHMASYRDQLVIATKAGYVGWEGPYGDWGSRKYLISSLDQSLKRMKLDYVDLFYHHRMDPETPLEETMGALADLVAQGKTLYIGLSNYDGPTLERAAALLAEYRCPFVLNQNNYSMFQRTVEENGLQKACGTTKTGIVAFSPLAQGLLSSKYLSGIPEDSRIKRDGRFLQESSITPEIMGKIQALNQLASTRGQSLSQMALAYTLSRDQVTTVLVGASRPEQILENCKALERLDFTLEELKAIEAII